MGTVKKLMVLDDEDILNLKQALRILYKEAEKTTSLDCLEIFTIQEIIKKWENIGNQRTPIAWKIVQTSGKTICVNHDVIESILQRENYQGVTVGNVISCYKSNNVEALYS